MARRLVSTAAVLLFCGVLWTDVVLDASHRISAVAAAQAPPVPPAPVPAYVTIPATVDVMAGRLASVTIESNGDVRWKMLGDELDSFREYDPDVTKIRLRFIAYDTAAKARASRYADPLIVAQAYLVAYATKDGKGTDIATCLITFRRPEPVPSPVPPTPPTPGPIPGPPAKKVTTLPYHDAYSLALAQQRPLVVWVNCEPSEVSAICTTATTAWNDPRPRIIISLYDNHSMYFAKEMAAGASSKAIEDELRRLLQPAKLTTEVTAPQVRPVMTRSC